MFPALILEFSWLLLIDLVFVTIFLALLAAVSLGNHAAYAVLKRNFLGYFSSPTGYAFICVFVILTSVAAFLPTEFFNSNLASFDQLNGYIPWIMLVFIPAITMSIWADERRQGTDELLLTLPATDFAIVIGKYLAAVSIFSASLLFSQVCNYFVLVLLSLGDLDTGLLFFTYFGYWLMGLAMLALGMVASFLTNNLTISFILGALVNVPLVAMTYAGNVIPRATIARSISSWSMGKQAEDFGRGVFGLSGFAYFVLVATLGVYLSMVLIGRRHWSGGRDGQSLAVHYALRVLALVVMIAGANVFFSNLGLRLDATEQRVNSLSKDTYRVIREMKAKHVVNVEAYVGAHIPEEYVKTRFELVSMLRELEAMSGGKVKVTLHDNLETFSNDAVQAEKRFGIRPRPIPTRAQGVLKEEQVLLGAGFTCGLEKVVVPFFDYGIPVEYELMRSINTVARGERKRLGVIHTDAEMMGGFDFNGGQPSSLPKQRMIDELEKQYEVEAVQPTAPIELGKYDVLLVVQPSSLGPQELRNVVDVVKKGQPTAIFEDPLPGFMRVPGTGQPKRQNPMASMFGGGPPPPKGNMNELWKAIGVKPEGEDRGQPGTFDAKIVWQRFNAYPKIQIQVFKQPEFVMIRSDSPFSDKPFNPDDAVTSGIDEVIFPFPGGIAPDPDNKDLKFTTLVETNKRSGTIAYQDFMQGNREDGNQERDVHGRDVGKYTLAARIQGKDSSSSKNDEEKSKATNSINVIYVCDIDLLSSQFFAIREQPDQEYRFRFENVTFVLNVIDSLAGENDYIGIRKRKTHYSTLKAIERFADEARKEEVEAKEKFDAEYNRELEGAKKSSENSVRELQEKVNELNEKKKKGEAVDYGQLEAIMYRFQAAQAAATQKFDTTKEKLRRDRENKVTEIRRDKDLQIENLKNFYRMCAFVIPPIAPLLVGLIVFVWRQLRERESISKTRLV